MTRELIYPVFAAESNENTFLLKTLLCCRNTPKTFFAKTPRAYRKYNFMAFDFPI